ncbi:MAG: Zn-dependent exopeptidase M28 [Clostridia bacterium]|nr:Zn-dependent exopeptidase M28 [Clostridia bacterium]
MNIDKINRILQETAYIRTGGSEQELACADYLKTECEKLGFSAHLEAFDVPMAAIRSASLIVDGKSIPCKGYLCAGSAEIEAPLYYMPEVTPCALSQCRGKIVLLDGYLGYWKYQDILANGAAGFITYDGNANYADEDIDQRELRSYVSKGVKLPGVNINAKSAIALVAACAETAKISLAQDEWNGHSHNVIAELPGETDEWIALTAHYDTTSLSTGAYDNMSGCIGLLGIAEAFAAGPRRRGLRLVFCGSEERGLLGSKAYCAAHEGELAKVVLNVNLDMIGSIMGPFNAVCTTEERLVHYIDYLASIEGFPLKSRQDIYSSDSTPFADKGVPAVSFARNATSNTATIHNSYDTLKVMSAAQLARDIDFICAFVGAMANAAHFPVKREIPEKMKEKLDAYLTRKRPKDA